MPNAENTFTSGLRLKVETFNNEDISFNKGAIYFDSDTHMTPTDFMPEMVKYLKTKGVIFYANEAYKSAQKAEVH